MAKTRNFLTGMILGVLLSGASSPAQISTHQSEYTFWERFKEIRSLVELNRNRTATWKGQITALIGPYLTAAQKQALQGLSAQVDVIIAEQDKLLSMLATAMDSAAALGSLQAPHRIVAESKNMKAQVDRAKAQLDKIRANSTKWDTKFMTAMEKAQFLKILEKLDRSRAELDSVSIEAAK